ncbi:hypothetical protein EDD16DRAFT_840494 [Pisolithus croceorrhizus]|nr:hypothetical protein EDD16DRAFT_840494 [Pisolithus croceorrhizus]
MVVLLAYGYLVIPFSFLRARWLWRYESFCIWRGYKATWRISRDWVGQSVRFLFHCLFLGVLYCYLTFRIDCVSGCCSAASSSRPLCWPTHCLHRISLSSSPRLSLFWDMILLDQRFRTVYLVSRFVQPLSRNLDFRVERCLGPVLLISWDGVRVFVRFLFLRPPYTPLHRLLESHKVSRNCRPSAKFVCYPHLSAPSSSYRQFATEDG